MSLGGERVRVRISNLFGDVPLEIGSAHIARRTTGAEIDPATDRALTFAGRRALSIPPGKVMISDPVRLGLPPLSDVAVSLFLPKVTIAATTHLLAKQTSYVGEGNLVGAAHFSIARAISSRPFLTGVDALVSLKGSTIVAFGDSTVDGDGSEPDTNHRWPDILAARLSALGYRVGVLNEGLIGNRLLRDSPALFRKTFGNALGQSGLRRFRRDVLNQPDVRCVIIRIGGNDISFPGTFAAWSEHVDANNLINGFRQLITEARRGGIRIVGTTLTPFANTTLAAGAYTPAKEAVRQRVNAWVRTSGAFDAIVDFDAILRDPNDPSRLWSKFDSGDHIHPNDAGYTAVANAITPQMLGLGSE